MLFFKKTCSLKFLPSKFTYIKICSIVQLEAAFQALSIFKKKRKKKALVWTLNPWPVTGMPCALSFGQLWRAAGASYGQLAGWRFLFLFLLFSGGAGGKRLPIPSHLMWLSRFVWVLLERFRVWMLHHHHHHHQQQQQQIHSNFNVFEPNLRNGM